MCVEREGGRPSEDLLALFARIERQVDVVDARASGIELWPLLRTRIADRAIHRLKRAVSPLTSLNAKTDSPLGASVRVAADVITRLVHEPTTGRRTRAGLTPTELVFLSRAEDHTDIVQGRRYDRHCDPLIELAGPQRCTKLRVGPRWEPTPVAFNPPVHLDPVAVNVRARLLLAASRAPVELREFLRACESAAGQRLVPLATLNHDLVTISSMSEWFGRTLERLRPRALFVVCFYAPVPMAAIRAARERGIVTVDLQHGKQGWSHPWYTHWGRVPVEGFSTVPDFFWVWGQESAHNINSTWPVERTRHRTVVGGNPWMSAWKADPERLLDARFVPFVRRVEREPRAILVTLQPLLEPLPAVLMDALERAPKSWLWLMRLHPHMHDQADQIAARLRIHRVENYELTESSRCPLYALMSRVDHHVTVFSSTCYESLAFGVPTTVLGEVASTLYRDYLRAGLFNLARSGAELVARLDASPRSGASGTPGAALAESTPYVVADRDTALQALEAIAGPRVG